MSDLLGNYYHIMLCFSFPHWHHWKHSGRRIRAESYLCQLAGKKHLCLSIFRQRQSCVSMSQLSNVQRPGFKSSQGSLSSVVLVSAPINPPFSSVFPEQPRKRENNPQNKSSQFSPINNRSPGCKLVWQQLRRMIHVNETSRRCSWRLHRRRPLSVISSTSRAAVVGLSGRIGAAPVSAG